MASNFVFKLEIITHVAWLLVTEYVGIKELVIFHPLLLYNCMWFCCCVFSHFQTTTFLHLFGIIESAKENKIKQVFLLGFQEFTALYGDFAG
jgi:hypothetical protein